MTRAVLLAAALVFAAPALAEPQVAAATTVQMPTQAAPVAATTDTARAPTVQEPAPAATPPTRTQVADAVDRQFGTYDKDADGALSKAEFAAWMTALKAQANVRDADPARATAWNDAAFRRADGDGSAGVTRVELTGFLVRGASGAS